MPKGGARLETGRGARSEDGRERTGVAMVKGPLKGKVITRLSGLQRRLPVLYWHGHDGVSGATDYVVSDFTDSPRPPNKNSVEYIAVKRCNTCALFNPIVPPDTPYCHRLMLAKYDGTSYCSEHIEKVNERGKKLV